jgi:hypothetical protein
MLLRLKLLPLTLQPLGKIYRRLAVNLVRRTGQVITCARDVADSYTSLLPHW